MSEKKSLSRRDILKLMSVGGALSMTPMEMFFESLAGGVVNRAVAESTGQNVKKYILIQEFAAPPRWSYDLFLSPFQEDGVIENGSVKTEYSGQQRYTSAIYKTHKVRGINAPVIWTQNVASSSGGIRPFSDLMDNMMTIMGVDALNPGHEPAAGLMNRPLTNLSIDGALADAQNLPFASLQFDNRNLDFKSAKGHNPKAYRGSNNIENLIPQAFNADMSNVSKKYHNEINNVVSKINRRISSLKLGGAPLSSSVENAETLIVSEINEMSKVVPTLEAKYLSVINKTSEMSKNLKGISDKPVGKTGSRDSDRHYWIDSRSKAINNPDMRSVLDGARLNFSVAKLFALTEYVITKNLTPSVAFRTSGAVINFNGRLRGTSFDQHTMGVMASVMVNTMYYRMVGACVLTLIEALKNTPFKGSNMFDHTVIRQDGEFSRSPRHDGSGTDHAPDSSNTTLFSGMIKGPHVVGEIKKGGTTGARRGSRGACGLLKHGVHATTGHIVSTLATMLDIPSPSPNNPSLVRKNNAGEIEPNSSYIEKTKVV